MYIYIIYLIKVESEGRPYIWGVPILKTDKVSDDIKKNVMSLLSSLVSYGRHY